MHKTSHIFMFSFSSRKKNALMPFPCWQTALMPFLNCWLASMPLKFNNVWRQFYICHYKTAVPPMVLILHPQCTISLIFRYFDVGWCLSRYKSGQSTRFWKFCESRRLRLRKNWCFGSKCSLRALFKISRKLFIYYCFHVCSLEDIIKFNLSMKFEVSMTISLSVVLLRTSVIPE